MDDRNKINRNKIIGTNIQKYRKLKGLTQTEMGVFMKKSLGQIYKYENGKNGVSALILWDLSDILGIEVERFYDGISKNETNTIEDKNFLPLVKNYGKLSEKERGAVLLLTKGLAEGENGE